MSKLKVYYAHSMHLYETNQEFRDIELLQSIGFEVINPNSVEVQASAEKWKKSHARTQNIMNVFDNYIKSCELLAFRPYPDGTIGSGVGYEINKAQEWGMQIIEIPNLFPTRIRSYEDTKIMLQLLGQR